MKTWKRKPKPDRDARLYARYLKYPGNIARVGRKFRVTRQWAWDIIKREKERHENREP